MRGWETSGDEVRDGDDYIGKRNWTYGKKKKSQERNNEFPL